MLLIKTWAWPKERLSKHEPIHLFSAAKRKNSATSWDIFCISCSLLLKAVDAPIQRWASVVFYLPSARAQSPDEMLLSTEISNCHRQQSQHYSSH